MQMKTTIRYYLTAVRIVTIKKPNYPSDKGLVSKIYKELKQIYKKTKQPHLKVGKDINRHFKRRHLCGQQTYEKNAHHHWTTNK